MIRDTQYWSVDDWIHVVLLFRLGTFYNLHEDEKLHNDEMLFGSTDSIIYMMGNPLN
jgi:hypothetical protein